MESDRSDPPLAGLRVIELAGIAPVPFAGFLLAGFGADVLRVDRHATETYTVAKAAPPADLLTAHKSSIVLNLKLASCLSLLLDLLSRADVLIDPFRPGVIESLGLDPQKLIKANPRLIVARLTGFRRDGKYSSMAGHDLNFLAVSGVLSRLGRAGQPPSFPVNLLADFAGGSLPCVLGILLALISRQQTGRGQLVDNNMVDGVSSLASMMRFGRKSWIFNMPRGQNFIDGGCPWYEVYETKDGQHMAVAALEPQFFAELRNLLQLPEGLENDRMDRRNWPSIKEVISKRFKEKTRKEWEGIFDGNDACVTPVLTLDELEREEFEQRPIVELHQSPVRADPGKGWSGQALRSGEGGERVLTAWMGWRKGREFEVQNGTFVKKTHSNL